MLGFSAILFTTISAFLGASIWAAVAGAAALVFISLFWHEQVYAAHEMQTNRLAQTMLLSGSILNAAVTSGGAFGLGLLLKFFWA